MPTESIYGIKKPKATASKKDITSASTLAFATHLSSLISQETSSSSPTPEPTHGRPRPSKLNSDIFSVRNKGAQKRAAADLADDGSYTVQQVHKRGADIGYVDEATLNRAKRKMTEKAKLYDELKKGEYLLDSSDEEDARGGVGNARLFSKARRAEANSLVDFDRKWAEEEARKTQREDHSDTDAHESEDDGSLVEYEDEFGRTRRGTKAEAAEAARLREKAQRKEKVTLNVPESARPERPANVIYGATVQAAAFNPDANIAARMADLAKRRDRSPTPEETHYDAETEVRNRGMGFYAFSKDEAARREEMDGLLRAREETMKERAQAASRKSARERAKEERRQKIEELRGKRRAEEFLSTLEDVIPSSSTVTGGRSKSQQPEE
ncbi:hypothetical protein VTO42DRAFT_5306 [Malbranchea cinnamomea]